MQLTFQTLQNYAARIVTKIGSILLDMLQWPSIKKIMNRETVTMAKWYINSLASNHLSNLLDSSSYVIALRNSDNDLFGPFVIAENGQQAFSHLGAYMWGAMKPLSKQITSLWPLRRSVKVWYLSLYLPTPFLISFLSNNVAICVILELYISLKIDFFRFAELSSMKNLQMKCNGKSHLARAEMRIKFNIALQNVA